MQCKHADEYWTISELAELLKIPTKTIYNWRAKTPPRGPRGFTVGKHVRFHRSDVDEWIDSLR